MPTFALAVDWETTGFSVPDYASKHQGIAIGAIIFDLKTLQPVEELYREIKFDPKYVWTEGAEKIHGLSRDHLEKKGVTQEEAAADLANLVIKYMGTDDIIALGHRVHFDIAFTNQLMSALDIELKWHPTKIDSNSIATVLMEMSSSNEIFETLGLPARGDHNALEDARYTLYSVQRIKELFLRGSFLSSDLQIQVHVI
jgi:DNA polymerase III epsilon subunit-like protein